MKKFKPVFLLMFVLSFVFSVSAYAAELTLDKPKNHTFAKGHLISDGTKYRLLTYIGGEGKARVKVYFSNENVQDKVVYKVELSTDGQEEAFAKFKQGNGLYRVEITGDASTYVYVNMYN